MNRIDVIHASLDLNSPEGALAVSEWIERLESRLNRHDQRVLGALTAGQTVDQAREARTTVAKVLQAHVRISDAARELEEEIGTEADGPGALCALFTRRARAARTKGAPAKARRADAARALLVRRAKARRGGSTRMAA